MYLASQDLTDRYWNRILEPLGVTTQQFPCALRAMKSEQALLQGCLLFFVMDEFHGLTALTCLTKLQAMLMLIVGFFCRVLRRHLMLVAASLAAGGANTEFW